MAMKQLQQELAELRSQVAELSAARQQTEAARAAAAGQSTATADSEKGSSAAPAADAEPADHSDSIVARQFDELMELLEREMRDLPAITCLAVFALGILMGRYLR